MLTVRNLVSLLNAFFFALSVFLGLDALVQVKLFAFFLHGLDSFKDPLDAAEPRVSPPWLGFAGSSGSKSEDFLRFVRVTIRLSRS